MRLRAKKAARLKRLSQTKLLSQLCFVQAFHKVIVQVGILHERSRNGLISKRSRLADPAIELLHTEIALANAHQRKQLRAPFRFEFADGVTQRRDLQGIRGDRLEAKRSSRVVLATRCLRLS